MTCRACWMNSLDRVPCLQNCVDYIPVNIPVTLTLRCHVMMTQNWSKPGGRVVLTSHVNGVPFGHIESSISSHKKIEDLARHFQPVTSDLGERQRIINSVMEIWPIQSPWIPYVEMPRLIVLNRDITIEHAPFMADDGRCYKLYLKDMEWIGQYGPAREIFTWDEWFKLREEKKQERIGNGKRTKSSRRS